MARQTLPLKLSLRVDSASDLPPTGPEYYSTAHDKIPNFARVPTVWSVRDGKASDSATWNRPLVDDAVVLVRGRVTWDVPSSPALKAVGVAGELTLASGSTLRAATVLVAPEGSLLADVTSKTVLSFPDGPIDLVADPRQHSHGLLAFGKCWLKGRVRSHRPRLAGNALKGDTALVLKEAVVGWQVGDTIAIPETRMRCYGDSDGDQWETHKVKSVSADGLRVEIEQPLAYDHKGTYPVNGVQEFTGEVLHLTRDFQIKSENSAGTRGHVWLTGRADIDFQNVQFAGLGRTQLFPKQDAPKFNTDGSVKSPALNQMGRYGGPHFHHVDGPAGAFATRGWQARMEGCSVVCLMNDFKYIWPLTVHDTHYSTFRNNVCYNWAGAGIITETNSEIGNIFEGNAVSRIKGTRERNLDWRDGQAYAVNANNVCRNNTASNCPGGDTGPGFTVAVTGTGIGRVPTFPGSMERKDINLRVVPMTDFSGNETYSSSVGFTLWTCSGKMTNPRVWHCGAKGIYLYPTKDLTISGFVACGRVEGVAPENWAQIGIFASDYQQENLTIEDASILWFGVGVDSFGDAVGTTTVKDSSFGCAAGVRVIQPWTVGDPKALAGRAWLVKNCRLLDVPKTKGVANVLVFKNYSGFSGNKGNWVVKNAVLVEDFNGTPGDDFRVYATQQAAAYVIPQTSQSVGSPEAGLTNAQALAKYSLCIAGEIAPADAVARPLVTGLVGK